MTVEERLPYVLTAKLDKIRFDKEMAQYEQCAASSASVTPTLAAAQSEGALASARLGDLQLDSEVQIEPTRSRTLVAVGKHLTAIGL